MDKLLLVSNIKFLRNKYNMTQEDLGKKLGLGNTAIANYEAGKRDIDSITLFKLSRIFDITIDSLLLDDLTDIEKYKEAELKALRNRVIHRLDTMTTEELKKFESILELID